MPDNNSVSNASLARKKNRRKMFLIKHSKYYLAVLITISAYTFHQGYAQPTSVLRTKPSTQLSNFHSIKLNTKLFSRTLLFLEINQNGEVSGTTRCSSQFVNMEMRNVGKDLVRIKGIKSGRYLAINSHGKVYSSMTDNDETVFKHIIDKAYESFASYKYYRKKLFDTFVGIRKNGKTKDGRRTKLSQKTVQFLTFQPSGNPC